MRIEAAYSDVLYDRIRDIESGMESMFDVVFVAVPESALGESQLDALSSLVESGPRKRVVLVGEHGQGYYYNNANLNLVAQSLGMNVAFSTLDTFYDSGTDTGRLCPLNVSHYLCSGMENPGLCDAATDRFDPAWQSYNADPVAYIYSHPDWPWILEDDTPSAGSRIAVHDSNLMDRAYDDDFDQMPYPTKNFRFVHNLCTLFAQ